MGKCTVFCGPFPSSCGWEVNVQFVSSGYQLGNILCEGDILWEVDIIRLICNILLAVYCNDIGYCNVVITNNILAGYCNAILTYWQVITNIILKGYCSVVITYWQVIVMLY